MQLWNIAKLHINWKQTEKTTYFQWRIKNLNSEMDRVDFALPGWAFLELIEENKKVLKEARDIDKEKACTLILICRIDRIPGSCNTRRIKIIFNWEKVRKRVNRM